MKQVEVNVPYRHLVIRSLFFEVDSEENSVLVEDYPYGFKRTQIRFWVETSKNKGMRYMSQTLNPATLKWNKPKAGTYYDHIQIIELAENRHISFIALSAYSSKEEVEAYFNFINQAKTEQELVNEKSKLESGVVSINENFSCGEIKFTRREAYHGVSYQEVADAFAKYWSQTNIKKVFENGGNFKVTLRRGITLLIITEELFNNLINGKNRI